MIEVRLPPASPHDYLQAIRRWRDVERLMADHPNLARLAARDGATLSRPIAEYVSEEVIPQIETQAMRAIQAAAVAPVVAVDLSKAAVALGDARKQLEWLSRDGVHEALGLTPPPPGVRDLRDRAIAAAHRQLIGHVRDLAETAETG